MEDVKLASLVPDSVNGWWFGLIVESRSLISPSDSRRILVWEWDSVGSVNFMK